MKNWDIVDFAEMVKATKRDAKKTEATAATAALKNLNSNIAIRIALPSKNNAAANVRHWWRTKMKSVSHIEQVDRGFLGVISSDGEFFFIQRNPKAVALVKATRVGE